MDGCWTDTVREQSAYRQIYQQQPAEALQQRWRLTRHIGDDFATFSIFVPHQTMSKGTIRAAGRHDIESGSLRIQRKVVNVHDDAVRLREIPQVAGITSRPPRAVR